MAESERPPRTIDSFVAAKKIGYVAITPIAESVAMSSQRRTDAGPDQHATTAATVTATPPIPRGSITRPMRCECDANHAWNSLGERLCQKPTSERPITSMPPASKPSTAHVTIMSVEARTERSRKSRLMVSVLAERACIFATSRGTRLLDLVTFCNEGDDRKILTAGKTRTMVL